jgi:hypothetical protein
MWETEAVKLLTDEQGRTRGAKVRKSDGLLHDVLDKNVMLACGGFEGNPRMLAKYTGNRTVGLPLIAPGLVENKVPVSIWRWKSERELLAHSTGRTVSLSIPEPENRMRSSEATTMASLSIRTADASMMKANSTFL